MLYALQIYFDSKPSFHRTGSKWAMLELPFQKRAIMAPLPLPGGNETAFYKENFSFES